MLIDVSERSIRHFGIPEQGFSDCFVFQARFIADVIHRPWPSIRQKIGYLGMACQGTPQIGVISGVMFLYADAVEVVRFRAFRSVKENLVAKWFDEWDIIEFGQPQTDDHPALLIGAFRFDQIPGRPGAILFVARTERSRFEIFSRVFGDMIQDQTGYSKRVEIPKKSLNRLRVVVVSWTASESERIHDDKSDAVFDNFFPYDVDLVLKWGIQPLSNDPLDRNLKT